ncbi:nondiscriminating glutamyl-tRNA synthetase EARS2, mitochondrial [Anabrus simplex]|uniref:nondiscriminating glutamyl-tRNA synthetase EARS2, mitochondrial n=1 Tax=Anabrus simplex TaxID=316456 RepID=UPI0035A27490
MKIMFRRNICLFGNLSVLVRVYNFKAFSSTESANCKVRVRFAPSPTGYLHLGGLRTALYNYLFAKGHNGAFVLRIEDTDQSRIVPDAMERLENDLIWAGIEPDESPSKGGLYGPYNQSDRLPLYSDQVKKLLDSGSAYHCFCSDRRLDLLRREALRLRQVPRYDNRCRGLSQEEVQDKLKRGEPHCVRFKLESHVETFTDLVYGNVSYDVTQNEGDPVIMKTDGFPTYHFANVVDDHFMEISHVLRGVEWQISTTKHILLYKAFGWEPPQFAHLPLIMNPDGTKLSKRQGDIRVESYRRDGIFSLALVNFVTNAGGGFSRDMDGVKPRIYSLQELSSQFDLKRLNAHSCRLMPDRLDEFNRLELQRQLTDEKETAALVQRIKQILTETFQDKLENQSLLLQDDHIRSVLLWSQKRIHRLTDLVERNLAFLWVLPSVSSLPDIVNDDKLGMLMELNECLTKIPKSDFVKEHLKSLLRDFASQRSIQFGQLMKLLRSLLSGLKEGPGVAEMMEILGPDSTASRIESAIAVLKSRREKTEMCKQDSAV